MTHQDVPFPSSPDPIGDLGASLGSVSGHKVTYSAACNASAQYLLKPFSISWEKSLRAIGWIAGAVNQWCSFTENIMPLLYIIPYIDIISYHIISFHIFHIFHYCIDFLCEYHQNYMFNMLGAHWGPWKDVHRTFIQVTRTSHLKSKIHQNPKTYPQPTNYNQLQPPKKKRWIIIKSQRSQLSPSPNYSKLEAFGPKKSSSPPGILPFGNFDSLPSNMAIEIVRFPIQNGGSFHSYVRHHQRVYPFISH